MNYAGKFEAFFAQGQGAAAPAHVVHGETVHGHAPADAIVVPDAHLLFNGDFKRSGVDLILSEGEREFVLHDYFKGEKHPALASPDGAHLTGDLVNALAGSVQVGQAGAGTSAGQVIGHVTKLQGNATVVRNGVSIILHMGDNVEKGDVLQSGSDSTVGVTFMDGTVFGLSSNARMVLNEMVYDPNGSSNSTLFSLVAGTISFVAGETAKHGDMKIDTPVATMGIRGTAVLVEIDFTVPGQSGTPNAKFQVLVEPDGTTGSYILFDKTTLQPIAVVNQAGQQVNITNGVVSQTQNPLSPELQKLINDVFTLKFTDNTNPNPKTTVTQNDSITPFSGPTFKLADGNTATPIFVNASSGNSHQDSAPSVPDNVPLRILGWPQAVMLDASGHVTTQFAITERVGATNSAASDGVIGTVTFVDANQGDLPSVSVSFSGASYHGHASPGAIALADIAATEVKISVVPADGNRNFGSAKLTYSLPDKAFDFLAEGETLTLTYTAEVNNNFFPDNESAFITFTITVTGSNDAPVITTAAQSVAFSGGTKTSGGPLTTDNPRSGTLTFTDVDLTDTHKVSSALKTVTLDGKAFDLAHLEPTPFKILSAALSAKLASDSTGTGTGSVTWTLADLPAYVADFIPKGETLTLTYEVTVTDSQGATSTKDVTVTITGTEPAAEVWISTGGEGQDGNWNNGINWETGNAPTAADDVIIITDQLHGLTPSFPVRIGSAVHAEAKSVSMNDFGHTPPKLVNDGTLTVGGALKLEADSILENFGTITLGGLAEILNRSTLTNSGKLVLGDGGDFQDQSSISNTGTIEIKGGTLNVSVDIANSDDEDGSGTIQVDSDATLAFKSAASDSGAVTIHGKPVSGITGGHLHNGNLVLVETASGTVFDGVAVDSGGTIQVGDVQSDTSSPGLLILEGGTDINGGTLTITTVGTLELDGTSVIEHGWLNNAGTVTIDPDAVARFKSENITNDKLIDISGSLTLGLNTVLTNQATTGHVTVESGGLLTLNGASISGGILTDTSGGTIALSGSAVITSVTLDNSGVINVTGTGNAFDGGSVRNGDDGAIKVMGTLILDDGAEVRGGSLTNSGVVDVESASGAVLDGVSVDNSKGRIDVDAADQPASKLVLKDATTISGGSLTIGALASLLEIATGANATLAAVQVGNAGTIQVDDNSSLALVDTTITGGKLEVSGTLDAEHASLLEFGTLSVQGASVFDGVTASNSGAIDITGSLTLDDGTVIANQSGLAAVTVEGGATLTLDDTSSIVGGTINNSGLIHVEDASATLDGVSVNNAVAHEPVGDIKIDTDAPSTLVVEHGTTITGGTLTIGDQGTLEVSGSGATLSGVEVSNSSMIRVDTDATLTLSGTTTIDHGTIDDYGKIDVTGTTTMTGVTASGAVSVEAHATLILHDTSFASGTLCILGTLESEGTSAIYNAEIVHDGLLQVNSGTLTVDGTLAGNAEIVGTSVLELADRCQGAYADAVISFATGASGTLKIDSAATFSGTVANFDDDDKIDLSHLAYNSDLTTSYSDGVLTVLDGDREVAHIKISGDNSGAHFVAVSDDNGGTFIEEEPGAITGLDAHGNAAEGVTLSASVTDGGTKVTDGVHYDWQVFDGGHWVHAHGTNGAATYTPVEADEGLQLRLALSFTDSNGNFDDNVFVSGGVVQEKPTGDLVAVLDSSSAQEGQTIHVTSVTDGGNDVSQEANYSWQILNGADWTEVGTGSSYTPGEAQEGHDLRVVVSYTESTGTESITQGFGTVAEKEGGDLAATYSSETAQQDQQIKVTGVTDGGTDVSQQATYSWQVSHGDGWTEVGTGSSYTPGEAQEGHDLRVVVSYTEPTGTESITQEFGTVAEKEGGDLVAVLDSSSAREGQTIHVTSVTDGGQSVIDLATYDWQVSSDGEHWVDAHGSNGGTSYTPVEADERLSLRLVTTLADDPSGPETTITSLGTVADRDRDGQHVTHKPPVIDTTQILLAQTGNKTTISGVQVTDADSAASTEIYTYSETALHGTLSGPTTGSGNLQQINAALGSVTDNAQNNSGIEKVTLTVNDSFGHSDSVSFVFSVGGNSGDKTALTGSDGKDVIIASSHNDQITGGLGADQFVFAPTKSDNADTITDFTHGQDRLDLRAFSDLVDVASLSDQWIKAHTSVVGQDTLITLNSGNHTDTILLQHVTSALQVGDFIVSPHHAGGGIS